MKPCLLLLVIMADHFADLTESDLACLLDQRTVKMLKKQKNFL